MTYLDALKSVQPWWKDYVRLRAAKEWDKQAEAVRLKRMVELVRAIDSCRHVVQRRELLWAALMFAIPLALAALVVAIYAWRS